MSGSRILVTGAAGFIGFHLVRKLLAAGHVVSGIDNLNAYYAPSLKRDRLKQLEALPGHSFQKLDLNDPQLTDFVCEQRPDVVVHLAAQAGVRYSIENPVAFSDSNLSGFTRLLEAVRAAKPKHLVFASSSSVYGLNSKVPFSVEDRVDRPISFYAATKRANELMGYSYSHLYQLPMTGLRFFTVYGSWGRPDMAYYLFADKIRRGEPIEVFNEGRLHRDFTHVSDIVESITRLLPVPPPRDREAGVPFRLLNIGASTPVEVRAFIAILENLIGKRAQITNKPMQPGDVKITYADVSALEQLTGYKPQVSLEDGLREFVDWHRSYVPG